MNLYKITITLSQSPNKVDTYEVSAESHLKALTTLLESYTDKEHIVKVEVGRIK